MIKREIFKAMFVVDIEADDLEDARGIAARLCDRIERLPSAARNARAHVLAPDTTEPTRELAGDELDAALLRALDRSKGRGPGE